MTDTWHPRDAGEMDFAPSAHKNRKPSRKLARSSTPTEGEQLKPARLQGESKASNARIARNAAAVKAAQKGKVQ
jgi:hypothetical protein